MAVAPYVGIPARDTQLSTWAQVFADAINAAPSTYGLSLTDASNIVTANTVCALVETEWLALPIPKHQRPNNNRPFLANMMQLQTFQIDLRAECK